MFKLGGNVVKILLYGIIGLSLFVGVHLNNQRLSEEEHNRLRIWVTEDEYTVLKEQNPIFEQQHDAIIEMEIIPSEQAIARLPLTIGTSDYPDIINVSHTMISEFVGRNLLTPITEIFGDLNILPTAKPAFKVMGEFYGIPFDSQTNILFYNRLNFPDGIEALEIMEHPERFSLAIDYRSVYHSFPFITGFGGYAVGLNNFGDINFYDIGLNKEKSVQGIEHMARLLDERVIGGTELDIYQAFIEGSSNILIAPSAIFESLRQEMPTVGFQAIPNFISNEIPYTYMRIKTYQLTKHVKNEELAIEYLKFLMSDEVATARNFIYGAVAPINYDTIISQDPYHLVVKMQLHRSIPLPNQAEFNYLYLPFNQASRQLVRNLEDAQEILNQAVREIDNHINTLRKE